MKMLDSLGNLKLTETRSTLQGDQSQLEFTRINHQSYPTLAIGHSAAPPPIPPRTLPSDWMSPSGTPPNPVQRMVGTTYVPLDKDTRSIRAAELKELGRWGDAWTIEHDLFQDRQQSLGADHFATLSVSHNLATIRLQSGWPMEAHEWADWLITMIANLRHIPENIHALLMKTESLMGEIKNEQGKHGEAESLCVNALARQQIHLGHDHPDTIDTRARLAMIYNAVGRHDNAITTAESILSSMKRTLGRQHIAVFATALTLLEYIVDGNIHRPCALVREVLELDHYCDVQTAFGMVPLLCRRFEAALGDRHCLTIRAFLLQGTYLTRANLIQEASDILHRTLTISEEAMGSENPLTIEILGAVAVIVKNSVLVLGTGDPSEAIEMYVRLLKWLKRHLGVDDGVTTACLGVLGDLHIAAKQYGEAQGYFTSALASLGRPGRAASLQEIRSIEDKIRLCQDNAMYLGWR